MLNRLEVIDLLSKGRQADIWYDAAYYGDKEQEAFIDRVQDAMLEAVKCLKEVRAVV